MSSDRIGNAGVDGGFSCNVAGSNFLDDRSANDVIDVFLFNGGFINETFEGKSLEIDGHFVLVDCGCHGERETNSVDDDNVCFGIVR